MFDPVNIQSFLSSVLSILRWVSLALVLLNYRAFPLVWHLRVFWTVILTRVNMAFIWFYHPWRREFFRKISPLGANPFELAVAYRTSVGFSDLDFNIHLSNSSYAKILDIARMRALLIWFPSVLEAGTRLGLGASHFHFLKEIPIGTEYEIRVNIVGWEEKWLYIVAQFVTYPTHRQGHEAAPSRPPRASASAASAMTGPPGKEPMRNSPSVPFAVITPPTSPVFEKQRLHHDVSRSSSVVSSVVQSQNSSDNEDNASAMSAITTPAISVSSSPRMDAKLFLSAEDLTQAMRGSAIASPSSSSKRSSSEPEYWRLTALPPLPEGAVLHCVHASSYCFKHGRITVPPRVALVASGFGDRSRGRWERVQEIRNTHAQREKEAQARAIPPASTFTFRAARTQLQAGRMAYGGLREILVGGWRRYEEEGLWNLTEYEERRRLGVERFSPLRSGLVAVSS